MESHEKKKKPHKKQNKNPHPKTYVKDTLKYDQ